MLNQGSHAYKNSNHAILTNTTHIYLPVLLLLLVYFSLIWSQALTNLGALNSRGVLSLELVLVTVEPEEVEFLEERWLESRFLVMFSMFSYNLIEQIKSVICRMILVISL